MTKCLKKYTKIITRLGVLVVLLWMQMMSIVTMHSHRLASGEIVWHFHPLSQSEQNAPSGHQHNSCSNYHGFSWQSTTWLLSDKPIVPPNTIHIKKATNVAIINRIVRIECPSTKLRAPPVIS
ncbi:MAG: hypothetical protein ACPGSG_09410 [Prolixibacteraceae bacterium]